MYHAENSMAAILNDDHRKYIAELESNGTSRHQILSTIRFRGN